MRRQDAAGSLLQHLEGENLEAVYDGAGALRASYLRGSIIDEVVNGYLYDAQGAPTNLTFHHDRVTSVVAVTRHTGVVEASTRYAPFGGEIDSTGVSANSLLFTGREREPDSGLYYYRARWYDPDLGRFLSEDPLGFEGGDVNLYAYVGNNPLRFNDPSGEVFCGGLCLGALAIGAAGVVGVGVPTAISNVHDYFTGASPDEVSQHNAQLGRAALIVGGTAALAPVVVGGSVSAVGVVQNPYIIGLTAYEISESPYRANTLDQAIKFLDDPDFYLGEKVTAIVDALSDLFGESASGGLSVEGADNGIGAYPSGSNLTPQAYLK